MAEKPQPIRISIDKAKEIIQKAAADSRLVFFTDHAYERMFERNVTQTQVMGLLKCGQVGEPIPDNIRGNWTCEVEGWSAGQHLIVVVAIENNNDGTVVITVFYP